jgi:peptidoglycan hydrolase-like protein with peptidoglycan-binding domain
MGAWGRWDVVGFSVAVVVTLAILINLLWMQAGQHPAPMFKAKPGSPRPPAVATPSIPGIPRARPLEAAPAAKPVPAVRSPGEIINDIQRELARRGYYEGVIDGLYGPRTDAAIREFEQANGIKPAMEPSEALLQAIVRAPARASKPSAPAAARPPLPVRSDVATERPASSRRVLALQRALADYGYGQLKPSGIMDAETQAAIERFERERRLPVTGQPSERVVRELSAMTGRALE